MNIETGEKLFPVKKQNENSLSLKTHKKERPKYILLFSTK